MRTVILSVTSRGLAVGLGAAMMIGETIRSWGQGRHPVYVLDDFIIGVPLVITAVLAGKPGSRSHAALVASFAACASMLYGSFVSKLINPTRSFDSNIPTGPLTALVGLGFAVALLGLILSLWAIPKVGPGKRGRGDGLD